jgi:hypothetical protein
LSTHVEQGRYETATSAPDTAGSEDQAKPPYEVFAVTAAFPSRPPVLGRPFGRPAIFLFHFYFEMRERRR